MGGAHLVDDAADLVLDLAGGSISPFWKCSYTLKNPANPSPPRDELLVGPLNTMTPSSLHIWMSWTGMEEFFTPMTRGFFFISASRGGGQGHAGQLGDVVDDEVGVGGGGGDIVPVLGDAVLGQVEVDGRDGGDGVHPQALGVGGQLRLSAVLLQATWAMTVSLPLASAITFSSTTLRSATLW